MIREIQEIKFQEYSRQLKVIESKLEDISRSKQLPVQRFTWLQKHITKRKEYAEYLNAQRNKIEDEWNYTESAEESALNIERQVLEEKIREVRKSTLADLGVSFESAIDFLESNGIPVVLTEEDKKMAVSPVNKEYKSTDDFILVRKTNHPPLDNKAYSARDAKAVVGDNFTYSIEGKQYTVEHTSQRNTVHFAVNGEVSPVSGGNDWNNMKYTILMPFNDVPKEQIIQAAPMDTYTNGTVSLTDNTWVLCPLGNAEELRRNNPNIKVIEYEGETSTGYASVVINGLGYKEEEIGSWSWQNEEQDRKYRQIVREAGLSDSPHFGTKEFYEEQALEKANIWGEMLKNIKENNLVKNVVDAKRINEQLKKVDMYEIPSIVSGQENLVFDTLTSKGIEIPEILKRSISSVLKYTESSRQNAYTMQEVSSVLPEPAQRFLSEFGIPNDARMSSQEWSAEMLRTFSVVTIGTEYEREQSNKKDIRKQEILRQETSTKGNNWRQEIE